MSQSAVTPSDLVLGTRPGTRPGEQIPYSLSPTEQAYHALLWGSTGVGKSKLLQSIFLQLVNKGQGVALIDPHADLALGCLGYLAARGYFQREDAFDKLIYVDFTPTHHLPLNVLSSRADPHTTSLNALEALVRTWPDLETAPLFRTLFLSCSIVLIANKLPLTAINALLLDREFRASCLGAVEDPLVLQVMHFLDSQGAGQAGSTLRRAFLLSFSPITRGCLGQAENWLDLRSLMDEGKSLIVNLGSVPDPVTKRLLGSLLLVAIEQAALSRTDQSPEHRRPFWCLVDEWPSFAATSAATIEHVLSQTRKFNLRLYLAAQALAQVDSKRLGGALENCRLSVTFRLGTDSARIQAHNLATIDPYRIKQAARTNTQRHQYMSTSEQLEEWVSAIMTLPPRSAFVRAHAGVPVRISTLTVPEAQLERGELDGIIAEYRRRYQRPHAVVAGEELGRFPTPPGELPHVSDILGTSTYGHTDDISDLATFFGDIPDSGRPIA
jgi:hypothetical protein